MCVGPHIELFARWLEHHDAAGTTIARRLSTVAGFRRPMRERAVGADAIPLTEIDGKGGELRDRRLDLLTSERLAPRRGGVRRIVYALAY
jgi:hypothetical protein